MARWNRQRGPRHGATVSLSFALAAPLLLTTCSPKNNGNGPGSEAVTTVRSALVSAALSPRQPNIRWQGRMQAIDIDPADPNFAVVASDHGGAWSTTDGGANWTRYDNLFPTGLMDVAICPTNRQVIVITASASTGTSLATDQGGIWRTDNGGTSWTRPAYNVPQNRFNAYGISFQPGVANCGTVFIGTDFGLAQCSSNATTCTNIVVPIATGADQVFSLVAHASGIVDVHTNFGHRRYDGTVFSPVRYPVNQPAGTQGLPNGFFANSHTLAIAPQNPNVIIGVSQQLVPDTNPTGNLVLGNRAQAYESDDGGATWTALGNPIFNANGRPAFVFAVPSRSGNASQFDVYLGDRVDMFRQTCTEAGGSGLRCGVGNPNDGLPLPPPWEFISLRQSGTCGRAGVSPCSHQDPAEIAFNPTTNCPLFIAGDGGVLKLLAGRPTATCGQTGDYDVTTGTIPALQLYEVTGQVHPGGTFRTDLFFSTQDNDIWASASGGDAWDANVEFEGAGLQIAHSMADRTNTLLTAYTCAGCFNFEGSPGFAAVTPWGWPDNFARRVAGNRKDRIVFSCPDVDRDGACDVCVDTAVPLLQCDIATSGVPCQDAQGLALTFASGTTPLPTCVGQPCVDAVNNTSGTPGPDGLCDPIGGISFQALAPVALPDGRYLQWDGGGLSFATANATPPVSTVLTQSRLWLSNVGGTTWTQVPGITLGTPGTAEAQTEFANWIGAVARGPSNTLVFYQPTSVVVDAAGNRRNGLRRVDAVTGAAPVFARADTNLPSLTSALAGFIGVAVDPSDSTRLLAETGSGIRRSTTSGQSWTTDAGTAQLDTLISAGGRLSPAVSAIGFDNGNGTRMLVGTHDGGVIASLDSGQSWARLCGSARVPFISKFFFDEVENRSYVSSYGRGIWTANLTQRQAPEFTTPPQPVTAFDCGPVNIGTAVATDACQIDSTNVTVTAAANSVVGDPDFGCQTGARPCGDFKRGPRTITWTAADEYGDVTTTTSVVTVDDRTPPVISPVSPITVVACNAAGETVVVPVPTAVDRCIGTVQVTGVVIASTTASVPRNVVNGQVSLPAGVHTIRWTATDGITSSQVTQVVTVRPGIFANRDLELRDRARTTLANGAPASVNNRGNFLTQIGSDATSGSVLSVARVDMRDRGHVVGGITTQGTLTRGNQTTVTGAILTNTPVNLPPFPSLAGVVFPPPVGTDQFINGTVTLAPGSYRSVTVNSGGTLLLSTGDYFFTGLVTVNSASTVRINDTAGPVRIFVSTAFAYRSRFQRANGSLADVFVGYRGTQGTVIEAPFLGTFIAPSATVEMGTGNVMEVRGRFAALNLIIRADTNLVCVSSFAATL
jgi:photosystem II stability/assembly factor-like uncharacterized protein